MSGADPDYEADIESVRREVVRILLEVLQKEPHAAVPVVLEDNAFAALTANWAEALKPLKSDLGMLANRLSEDDGKVAGLGSLAEKYETAAQSTLEGIRNLDVSIQALGARLPENNSLATALANIQKAIEERPVAEPVAEKIVERIIQVEAPAKEPDPDIKAVLELVRGIAAQLKAVPLEGNKPDDPPKDPDAPEAGPTPPPGPATPPETPSRERTVPFEFLRKEFRKKSRGFRWGSAGSAPSTSTAAVPVPTVPEPNETADGRLPFDEPEPAGPVPAQAGFRVRLTTAVALILIAFALGWLVGGNRSSPAESVQNDGTNNYLVNDSGVTDVAEPEPSRITNTTDKKDKDQKGEIQKAPKDPKGTRTTTPTAKPPVTTASPPPPATPTPTPSPSSGTGT